ncbi:FkbM family methyltransferase [Polaribacter sp. Hel_I_88]|uniref:FkbM family methyltransferase n=1 Tax=Polaribacter sp. Hel_I_88 TaxID=1250006 RepID=UPI00047E3D1C|nr:FkbM family methyltransferase [Polaribacter sp. Hel_I_88]
MEKNLELTLHEKVLTKLFNQNDKLILFDIGACEGLSSVRYLSLFPSSQIYVFEPVPSNYKIVLKNKETYNLKNMHTFELGLSSKIGEATFYVSSGKPENKDIPSDNSTSFGNKSSSLYKPGKTKEIHPWLQFNESITIKTETLENFCTTKKISLIDFIHMDVQGAELMVLEGSNDMISNIKSVWLEVEEIELYEKQALRKDIENFFLKNNFICILNKVNHIAGDQFWVRKTYFESLDSDTKSYLNIVSHKTELKSKISSAFGKTKDSIKNVFKG